MMKNNYLPTPTDLARVLGSSIIDSVQYRTLIKTEEEVLNNEVASELLSELKTKQKEYADLSSTDSHNREKLVLSLQEIQRKIDDNDLILNYYRANEDYEKLLKNIYNIIDFIIGKHKLTGLDNDSCNKCNSNCSGCAK